MGKGFDVFMKNPYWKGIYDNAPSDNLRAYYKISFDISPFVMGEDYENEEADRKMLEIGKKLTKADVQYMYENTAGGMQKKSLKKWLDKLD